MKFSAEENEQTDRKTPTWEEFTQEVTMHGIRYVHLSHLHPVMR